MSDTDEESPQKRFILGEDITTKEKVFMYPEAFNLGGYIIGARGSGKSKLLLELIAQSMKYKRGLCVIDPHGDLLDEVFAKIPQHRIDNGEVIYLDPFDNEFPFGINIFHCEDKYSPRAVERTVSLVTHLFKKLWPSESAQPLVEDVLLQVTRTIIANELTMTEVVPLLTNDRFRAQLLKNVTNPDVLAFWDIYNLPKSLEREQGGSTIARRVRQFTSNEIIRHIVGQDKPKLNLRDVMDSHRILLVKLYSEDWNLTSLVGSTLIGQFLQAALSRADVDQKQRADFDLYCDEFAKFATDDFAEIISECRKYHLNPYVSHQSRGQLNESVQDSVIQLGSLFCFKVIGRDSEVLALDFDATPPDADDREKTIPSDVLMHLSDHPNQHVKDFERSFVRKLLQAKALRVQDKDYKTHPEGSGMGIFEVTRTETIYPKFTFDDAPITFNPDDLLKFLEVMETFLFDVMLLKNIDMQRFNHEVLLWWAYCCSGMFIPHPKRHVRKDYSKYFDPEYEQRDQRDINERYERFKTGLLRVAAILMYEPIRVFPSTRPDENISQETFANMRNRIANTLAKLPPRTMRVRLPIGEYTLKTVQSNTTSKDGIGKKNQVIAHTRKNYTTLRQGVEEQIRERIKNDNVTPTTKRTHTL